MTKEVRNKVWNFRLQEVNEGLNDNTENEVGIRYLAALSRNLGARVVEYSCPLCDGYNNRDVWENPEKAMSRKCSDCNKTIRFELSPSELRDYTMKLKTFMVARDQRLAEAS
jgi:hypothetical protein